MHKISSSSFKALAKTWIAAVAGGLALSLTHIAVAEPHQSPLFLMAPVKPIVMLNMSRDHQLFFKLYDDYGDLTDPNGGNPDTSPDTTYITKYEYYGYFDSKKCYKYNTTDQLFEPKEATTSDHYCTANSELWSGNFLNWASMTRMDAVRKILYGGLRSTDSGTATVLERALLPHDAHSFAKFYDGSDIEKLTPFTVPELQSNTAATGITICNTTADSDLNSDLSQAITSPPLLRVAKGNYSLWASNERWQCRFDGAGNDNVIAGSGIYAYGTAPSANSGNKLSVASLATNGEYVARVKVCVEGLLETNCKQYPTVGSAKKPIGLLQEFGEDETILFGLMTGSYSKNKSGGVLRKAVGNMATEININTNGTFTGENGALKTLNSLKIYGYNYGDGTYSSTNAGNDSCPGGISGFANGTCSNWGNPQSEIYLESLRYLGGASAPLYLADDSTRIAGLGTVGWPDSAAVRPLNNENYCAPLSVLQFNASSSSFDDDELAGASDIGVLDINALIDELGKPAYENLSGSYFVGQNSADKNGICTGKAFSKLSEFLGTCPDAPRLKGSYAISGLAHYARKNDINSAVKGTQVVRTYGVALAPAVPSIKIPVPGTADKKIEILPACKSNRTTTTVDGQTGQPATREGNCAIVDFKIVQSDIKPNNIKNTAKLYVNWESAEQGLDYDQDVWGTLDIEVVSNEVRVTSRVYTASTAASMGFGYVLSGTANDDGFKVHSGLRDFIEPNTYCDAADKCTCRVNDGSGPCEIAVAADGTLSGLAVTPQQTYSIATTTASAQAKFLKSPLELAAKWGGYSLDFEKAVNDGKLNLQEEIKKQPKPEAYFYATDPRTLEKSLRDALKLAAATTGSSATVASNSTRLEDETKVYQALFNSKDWSGAIRAYPLKEDGKIDQSNISWDTDKTLTASSTRKIYTLGDTGRVNLSSSGWTGSAASALKAALQLSNETTTDNAQKRFNWLLGTEQTDMRKRTKLLGDIVNSDPGYAGAGSQRYNVLPATYGAATYEAYVGSKVNRTKAVFVGANDGMMHAFNAETGAELFAYIPRGVYAKLASLSNINYQHTYTVDGPLYVGDAYITVNGTKQWRTLVGGTLGAGGRGAYLLDVTDVLATGGEPRIIFDIHADDTTLSYKNDLGYSNGKMLIVPAANDRWVAVLSNGTESTNGTAKLIAIDVETPSSFVSIATSTQSGNGLSGAALLPNSQGVSTYAYAGDLKGNMWKFDLTSGSIGSWGVAYNSGNTPKPLITVVDSTGTLQPITGTPTLGRNALKMAGSGGNQTPSIMVYFGTGKYSEVADIASTAVQSIYAIADTNSAISITAVSRSTKLKQKVITAEANGLRTVTPDATPVLTEVPAVTWSSYDGWYLDLKYGNLAKGERVIVKPLLLFDRLIVNTFIPSPNQCDYGGSGWLMELTGVGDKFIGLKVLLGNANIELVDPILGDLIPIMAGEKVVILGSELSGDIEAFLGEAGAGSRGRMSWRQIK